MQGKWGRCVHWCRNISKLCTVCLVCRVCVLAHNIYVNACIYTDYLWKTQKPITVVASGMKDRSRKKPHFALYTFWFNIKRESHFLKSPDLCEVAVVVSTSVGHISSWIPGTVGLPCLLVVVVFYWGLIVCQTFVISPLILKKIQHSVVYELAIFKDQKLVKCWQFCMLQPNIFAFLYKYYCPQFQNGTGAQRS